MAVNKTSTEYAKPEIFVDFLVQFAEDPECNVSALCRRVGLSPRVGSLLKERLQTRYLPALKGVEKTTTRSLLQKMDLALPRILDRLADEDLISKTDLKDAAWAMNSLIDKRQLLRGEPTQILSFEERKNINELAPEIVAEIRKRALPPVDVDFEDIPLDGPIDATAVSVTARRQAKREDRGRV